MDNQQSQPQNNQSPPQDFYSERGQRANKKMIAVVVIVSALLALGVAAYQYFAPEQIPEQVVCAQEVKQCLDGSYVSRQAPNCEFAECPNNQNAVSKITVLSPNGGEKWEMGKTYDIKWSSNTTKNLDIRLMEGAAGTGERYIAQNIPNSGVYSWTIPDCRPGNECLSNFQIPAGQYKISIHEVGTSDMEDISDALFSIATSQDSIANWQIYRNVKYGFELKYPKDWFSQQCGDSYVGFSYDKNKLPLCFTDAPQPHINIKIFGPETGLNIYTQHTESSLNNSTRTAVKIGEIPATKVVGTTKKQEGPGPLPGLNFISEMFSYKGNVYDFYYFGLDDKDYSKIFDQILSAIKFTK